MNIIVIGAGLGGLAVAQGLHRKGFKVEVYERDAAADSRAQGYRVSLNALGMDALRELLPPERFRGLDDVTVADVGEGFTFADARMRPLLRFPAERGARTVRRAALRRHLTQGVPVNWGARFAGLRATPGGVTAAFADGSSVDCDLLVGADGANSVVRGPGDVVDLGLESLGGHVDRDAGWDRELPLNRAGAVQYFGPAGWSLFVSLCEREDRTPTVLWALSHRVGAAGRTGLERAWPVARAAMALEGWHPVLRRLVEATPPDALIPPLTLRSSRSVTLPGSPRVTLLGDAAHLMPPQRGFGANSAFADARSLVAALSAPGATVPSAVAAYEREMVPRARKAVQESQEAAQMFHFRNPLAVAARTAGLRTMSLLRRAA